MATAASEIFRSTLPEAIEFAQSVRRHTGDRWHPAHVCRRHGSIATGPRGRRKRFSPGDVIIVDRGQHRVIRAAKAQALEFKAGEGVQIGEAVAREASSLGLAPAYPKLFAVMVARERAAAVTPGRARRLHAVALKPGIASGREAPVVSMSVDAGTSALNRIVAEWNEVCTYRNPERTRKRMLAEAVRLRLRKRERRLRKRERRLRQSLVRVRKTITAHQPYSEWLSAALQALRNLLQGTRAPDGSLTMVPRVARRRIRSARAAGRRMVSVRKALDEAAGGAIDLSDPRVAAAVQADRAMIVRTVTALPEGFVLRDAMYLRNIAARAEIVLDHVESLDRVRQVAQEAERRRDMEPTEEPEASIG